MKKIIPYLFLIPALLSVFMLPSTFRGETPLPMTPTSHILSIFIWLLLFCLTFGISRGSSLSRVFVFLALLTFLSRTFYRWYIGETDWGYALIGLVGSCIFASVAFTFSPPIRKRLDDHA